MTYQFSACSGPSAWRVVLALSVLLGLVSAAPGLCAEPPKVLATITPLHGLAAAVTDGVSAPQRLLSGAVSAHMFSLRPSQARALARADVILWVGEMLETPLAKPLSQFDSERLLTVSALPSVTRLPARDPHHAASAHAHRGIDPHLWLAPPNARHIVAALTERLIALDPANAARYRANAARTAQRINALDRDIAARLAPLRAARYLTFHDAYQYFEHHFGLSSVGALAVDPDRRPGARRVRALRATVQREDVRCVFAEPQFEPRLLSVLTEGTDAKVATLDPIGAGIAPGADAWFLLMRGLADALVGCLTP